MKVNTEGATDVHAYLVSQSGALPASACQVYSEIDATLTVHERSAYLGTTMLCVVHTS